MAERLYQTGFGGDFEPSSPENVTPKGFAGVGADPRQKGYERLASEQPQELGRFVREVSEPVMIRSPQEAAAYLQENVYTPFDQFDQEEMWALLVDTKNRITHEAMIYRGTVNTVSIRPAELFKEAVRVNATALILSHCHPSGISDPSPEDVAVTRSAYQNSLLLGIELLDHIVVGKGNWVSLKERGLGFNE